MLKGFLGQCVRLLLCCPPRVGETPLSLTCDILSSHNFSYRKYLSRFIPRLSLNATTSKLIIIRFAVGLYRESVLILDRLPYLTTPGSWLPSRRAAFELPLRQAGEILSMPSDENIDLEAGIPSENIELEARPSPSSSRHGDPGGEDVASGHVPRSVHAGDPALPDTLVVSDPVGGDDDEIGGFDTMEYKFRPGYEEGLLVFLQRFAHVVVSERRQKDIEKAHGPLRLHLFEKGENLKWARTTLSAIKNRDEHLPELPTDVSHPLLRRFVYQVNQRRHKSICRGMHGSQEGLPPLDLSNWWIPPPRLLQQPDPPWLGPSMTSRLFEFFRSLSRHTDRQQGWQSLKTIADDVTSVCPLPGSLRVTVCDFGDGTYNQFDTTLESVEGGESSEALYFTPHLRMLMVTRTNGKATVGKSPLDVRRSAV